MNIQDLNFVEFVTHLSSLGHNPIEASAFADDYLAAHAGAFPIIENNLAHFVYKTSLDICVGISAEWNGFNPGKSPMTPLGGGILHYQHQFEPDARLDYFLFEIPCEYAQSICIESQNYGQTPKRTFLDPLNSRLGDSGFGPRSELAMPRYQRPAVTQEQSGIQHGAFLERTMKSEALDQERAYVVYLPPGYSPNKGPYPSIYFHDGGDYLTMGKAPIILDNLIHNGSLPPTIAIFLPPVEREEEYNCNDQFVHFFCDELVSETMRLYHLTTDS